MAADNIWSIIYLCITVLSDVFIWISLNMFVRSTLSNTNDVLLVIFVSLHECHAGIILTVFHLEWQCHYNNMDFS